MRLLVLGGSEFVGRAVVEVGLSRGWEVTTLNRGNHTDATGVTALRGDRRRRDGMAAVAGHNWDIVVDTWSWEPSVVQWGTEALAERANSYVYISSRSVYEFPTAAGAAEDSALVDASPDDGPGVDYARAKRGGELAATNAFGERALLARAGLILGPGENVGRLPWWLNRIVRGGRVLAPAPAELGIQLIDARDLATFVLDAAGKGLGGPYNLVSPESSITMGELLHACVQATRSDAELQWTDPGVILEAGVEPWTEIPIWVPRGELHDTMHRAGVAKAVQAGLALRPVRQTVGDTWKWLRALGGRAPQRPDRTPVGLASEVEARVLASAQSRGG
jgi:2'-hydroxyisoflavone reductase